VVLCIKTKSANVYALLFFTAQCLTDVTTYVQQLQQRLFMGFTARKIGSGRELLQQHVSKAFSNAITKPGTYTKHSVNTRQVYSVHIIIELQKPTSIS
jgi:hypothetical protein